MQVCAPGEPQCFKSVQLTNVDFPCIYMYLFSYRDRRGDILFFHGVAHLQYSIM